MRIKGICRLFYYRCNLWLFIQRNAPGQSGSKVRRYGLDNTTCLGLHDIDHDVQAHAGNGASGTSWRATPWRPNGGNGCVIKPGRRSGPSCAGNPRPEGFANSSPIRPTGVISNSAKTAKSGSIPTKCPGGASGWQVPDPDLGRYLDR